MNGSLPPCGRWVLGAARPRASGPAGTGAGGGSLGAPGAPPPAAVWRAMEVADLAGVKRVGETVHPDYPEEPGVMAERLQLYPAGCRVLEDQSSIQGYAVSHPWLFDQPPTLNRRLGRLPVRPDTFYIHDIALLPGVRGRGYGGAIAAHLVRLAQTAGLKTISLVAVSGSEPFWRRNGFAAVGGSAMRADLRSYGAAARLMVRLQA